MIPVKLHEGKLVNEYGELIEPNENGLVEIEIEGKIKRFVPEKLIDYLGRKGQVYKNPVLRRNKTGKAKVSKITKQRIKTDTRGRNRCKKVIITDLEGKEVEFESIVKASIELKICKSKMFSVLSGKKETLKGYKIKYAI